jgi:hypothetical protein
MLKEKQEKSEKILKFLKFLKFCVDSKKKMCFCQQPSNG